MNLAMKTMPGASPPVWPTWMRQTTRPVTLGKPRKKLMNLLPGSQLIALLQQRLSLELMGSGQVLWLYRP